MTVRTDRYQCGLPVAMTFLATGAVAVVGGMGWLIVLFVRALPTARFHGLL